MTKSKEIKVIREIKPKIKVIELKKEEKEDEITEESLEDIAIDAPSAREFPEFAMPEEQGSQGIEQRQEFAQTPSATTEEENKNAVRYQIQGDVTEEEITRTYRTEISGANPIMLGTTKERAPRERLANRELEAIGTRNEESKYKISINQEQPVKKRKYPWEA